MNCQIKSVKKFSTFKALCYSYITMVTEHYICTVSTDIDECDSIATEDSRPVDDDDDGMELETAK